MILNQVLIHISGSQSMNHEFFKRSDSFLLTIYLSLYRYIPLEILKLSSSYLNFIWIIYNDI